MGLDEDTGTLFVANHRRSNGPAIEVFKLDISAATATHIRTVEHRLIHGPNSIAVVSDTEFYVTNDHYFLIKDYPKLAMLETYLAPPLGSVVHVKLASRSGGDEEKVEASVVARLPYANGIEFLNTTTIAIASTSNAAVYLYTVAPQSSDGGAKVHKPPKLSYTGTKIRLPFLPDNLSIASSPRRKTLLVAGHPHVPSTVKYAKTRHICNDPVELQVMATAKQKRYCEEDATATSWVSEWDPATGELRHLYSGTEYPSSATAARDNARGVGIVAGLYAKGLLVWRD